MAKANTPATPAAEKVAVVKQAALKTVAELAGYGLSVNGKKKSDAVIKMVPYKSVTVEKDFNPRKNLGDLEGLEATIKAQGLIQPMTVRPVEAGAEKYHIVAGERRFRVLGGLGWEMIPVIIREDLTGDDLAAKAVAGAENGDDSTRMPLTHAERGALYKTFSDQAWSIKKIAKETGGHERDVRRCLELVSAPEDVQSAYGKGKLNFSTAIAVAGLDDDTRKAAMKEFTADDGEEASQAKVKAFAKEFNKGEDTAPGKSANKKKGKAKAAGLKAWKGKKVLSAQLAELCYLYTNMDAEEKGSTRWFEMRGAIGCFLWQMGDVNYPVMVDNDPDQSPDAKEAKKELKRINEIIDAHASNHTPDASEDPADPAAGEGATAGELVGAAAD